MNDKKESPPLTKVELAPFVELIVTDSEGRVLSTFGSNNAPLASVLSTASKADDQFNPVKKDKEALTALGQDFYRVDRTYVLMVRGTFFPAKTMAEITELEKTMPETAQYTFVVSY